MKKIKNGFTLLELLVVIGIIGILVALATVSYSAAQKSSRDSRRKQDMIAIQNALEQYYSDNSYLYPATSGTCATLGQAYMKSAWPKDPLGTTYTPSCTTSSYCFCATMEKTTAGNSSSLTCASGGWTSSGAFYCVANLQ